MSNLELLKNRDYTLIIDKSGSMTTRDCVGGKTRWEAAKEGTLALASKIEEFDPDGITLYTFASSFKRYDNVTASKVNDVYAENDPMGSTALAEVLTDAFNDYFKRKAAGQTKTGDTILVVTDGEPNDKQAVVSAIIAASKKMDRDEELAVSFVQIGKDAAAGAFLKQLDDDLQGKGAKFDIVDTVTFEEAEERPLVELLVNAITD